MAYTWFILQKSIPLLAILVPFSLLVAYFSGYGIFSVFLTSLLLIISPLIFKFSKQIKGEKNQKIEGEEDLSHNICDEQRQDLSFLLQACETTVQEVQIGKDEPCLTHPESFSQEDAIQQRDNFCKNQINGCLVGSTQSHHDLYSETESIDPSFSSEDSDHDYWTYSGNFGQSPECSDDSISDEESLIEIAIPTGHYVCPKQDPKFTHLQQKFQHYNAETFLDDQHGLLVEQFAKINEMNDEDNLIEIDLSMGSIKCSRFEIEA